MRNSIVKRLIQIVLPGFMLLVVAGCAQSLVPIPPLPTRVIISSETPQAVLTAIPTIPALLPSATAVPTPTIDPSVKCFPSYGDPIAFMPDGKRLLVQVSAGVQIFDFQSMQEEKFIKSPSKLNGPFVALSPDGTLLAWSFEDGTIQMVSISDQKVLKAFNPEQISPVKLEFSPTGDRLYSASHDGSVKVWDLEGNQLDSFQPGGEVVNIGLSADGGVLATIPDDGSVKLWDASNFKLIKDLGGSGGYDTSDVVFSPDGQFLAADLVTRLYYWRISDGKDLLESVSPINSLAVAFSPDGHNLAFAYLNNILLGLPTDTGTIHTLTGHQAPVFELLFSPDGSTLVSADDVELRVWRVEDGKLLAIGRSSCP